MYIKETEENIKKIKHKLKHLLESKVIDITNILMDTANHINSIETILCCLETFRDTVVDLHVKLRKIYQVHNSSRSLKNTRNMSDKKKERCLKLIKEF